MPTTDVDPAAEKVARAFHEAYERLAPRFGYTTRMESSVPWEQVPIENRQLMVAVCAELLDEKVIQTAIPLSDGKLTEMLER